MWRVGGADSGQSESRRGRSRQSVARSVVSRPFNAMETVASVERVGGDPVAQLHR